MIISLLPFILEYRLPSFLPLFYCGVVRCILQLVDYYTNGQHCDETEGTRSTDVHIQCCNGLHVNSPNKDIVTSVAQKNQPHARLNGVPNPPISNEVQILVVVKRSLSSYELQHSFSTTTLSLQSCLTRVRDLRVEANPCLLLRFQNALK